ncbi:histidine phosphatase family protein [Anaeroselena agilis]|uniref:Histidine phosphatase family protein n=1 Tax=Anaeroselena agilis TaxID=3063788 RepID=A0ABU3NZC8_9FIRM|nr:histidine phosphatase family protein [Selenomonadales bacterium 4137-cl]
MYIILFHTGEAEEKQTKQGETRAVLTKNGEKAVVDAAQGLDRIIPRKIKTQVWSSMLPAASQTAELVAEELGVKRRFLKTLDTDDLSTLLAMAFEHCTDDCLIFVSRQPYLGDWSRKLAGLKLPFGEASAAGFTVDQEAPAQNELLWFIQPRILKRIG